MKPHAIREHPQGRPPIERDPKTAREAWGANLRRIRTRRFATIRQFHVALGEAGKTISLASLTHYETGRRPATVDTIYTLARVLGVRPQSLMPDAGNLPVS